MLNEERIRLMAKAAEFEEKEGREAFKVSDYFCGDYVTLHMVKAGISGTFAFVILAALWAFYQMDELLASLHTMDLPGLGMSLLKGYMLFIIVYEIIVCMVYYMKYSRMKEKLKEYYGQLKEISSLYEEEDRRLGSREITGGLEDDDDFV